MVGDEAARKLRLLAAAEGVVEVMLDGELADLGDLGVVDLDFAHGAGGAGSEGEREEDCGAERERRGGRAAYEI